ncbi:MAG: NB-ARC domain-containing protein, partial [Elainellaceae cyanobacterium]
MTSSPLEQNQDVKGDRNQTIGQMLGGTAIGNVEQNVTLNQTVQPQPRQLTLHQLPPDIADFTGRGEELQQLRKCLQADGETAVVISAVAGMGGVGKSALAIRTAHQLTGQFPDAQFYVDLRGADGEPLDPHDVLARWLRAFGLDEGTMPRELRERAAAFRDRLSTMRAIVLLDNAADEAQVRPLLPGSASCAVIVTSRRRLGALPGAEILDLAVLPVAEAMALLAKVSGRGWSEAERGVALQIVTLCGRLPLALRIAGGTLKEKRHWTLGSYASRLADERQRLERLKLSDLDVRASFMLSHGELREEAARLFRWLGLMEHDFGLAVAAVLLAVEEPQAEAAIEALVDAQLLEVRAVEGGIRYACHDLVRLLAQEELERETEEARNGVRRRVMQHYLERSNAMDDCLSPVARRSMAQDLAEQQDRPLEEIELALQLQARSWFERERQNLLMSDRWAIEQEDWATVVSFAPNLGPFFRLRGYWGDAVWAGEQALSAAQQQGDRYGEGQTLGNLGNVYQGQG